MADVVTRLVVESKEYDSKIQRATAGLTALEQHCKATGKSLADVDKETLDYVKALGKMETVSSSAVGSLSELQKAFKELSVQYKNLSADEKKSPYGKAMAASLEQLKGRIGDLGGQLDAVNKEMKGSKGFVDQFTDALGSLGPAGQLAGKLLKGAFGPVGIAIAAVVGVVQQVVAAFKRNEDAMASASRAAAPFKAIWNQIERLFDKLVPHIASGIEKISNAMQSLFGKFTDWINKLGSTALGKKLGLDKLSEQLKKAAAEQAELTASNKKIADSENELNKLRRSSAEANARDEQKIAQLRADAAEKDKYNATERIKMLEEAGALEEKILKRDVNLKQKELDLIKLKSSLTADTTEELNEESAAQVALTQAKTAYYEKQRALQKQLQAAKKEEIATTRAQIEQDANERIAGLDRMTMGEQEYADTAYEIQKKMFDDIAALYDKDSQEYAQVLAKKAQLDVQYQNGNKTRADKELAQQKALDNKILSGLTSAGKKAGWNISDFGGDGVKTKIEAGIDITEDEWKKMQDKINERLASLGLDPIQINFETGNIEQVFNEVSTQLSNLTSNMSSGVGAISTLGNAFNDLKGIGEDLTAAFSGEMDAWDSLMTVFNSGIGIMQTVIGVMEAINTLQELASTLSDMRVAKQAAETTAVVTGKGAEVAATTAEASVSAAELGVDTADATAKAAKSVAWIPIAGPALAAAAIAAILGAIMGAQSQAKSAGKFAQGGVVGGNSYSGDRLMAYVNSGETILTPSQADKAMAGIQGNPMQNLQLSTEISGTNLRIVMNNDNRSKGGSRGYYANIH